MEYQPARRVVALVIGLPPWSVTSLATLPAEDQEALRTNDPAVIREFMGRFMGGA